jgi:hypothetical protein
MDACAGEAGKDHAVAPVIQTVLRDRESRIRNAASRFVSPFRWQSRMDTMSREDNLIYVVDDDGAVRDSLSLMKAKSLPELVRTALQPGAASQA